MGVSQRSTPAPIAFDDVTPLPDSEDGEVRPEQIQHLAEVLRDFSPAGSDPRVVAEAIRAFAGEEPEQIEPEHEWFRHAFTTESLLTRPPRLSEATKVEARFIANSLGMAAGSRFLDVGCGYGRLTNHLADAGYCMVGLDLSEDMLKRAQRLASKTDAGAQTEYVWGDMRHLEYAGEFDGVLCTDTTFGYFGDAENLIALRGMAGALRPGGRLIIDTINRSRVLIETPGRSWWEGQGCLIQEDTDFDQHTSRLRIKRLMVFSDGRQIETMISIRLYTSHELIGMCRLVGLQLVEMSGSPHEQGAYFSSSSRRMVITAQRT